MWVSFNGVAGRVLLTLFMQSYKGFKGKFFKIRCNDSDPSLLDGFPLYWTKEPEFQNPDTLKTYPGENERCVSSSSTSRQCLAMPN